MLRENYLHKPSIDVFGHADIKAKGTRKVSHLLNAGVEFLTLIKEEMNTLSLSRDSIDGACYKDRILVAVTLLSFDEAFGGEVVTDLAAHELFDMVLLDRCPTGVQESLRNTLHGGEISPGEGLHLNQVFVTKAIQLIR